MTAPDPINAAANESANAAANAEQRAASNPAVSAFVSASAGSGKTKLLTDRLLRLMLAGTPPQKILCLTYTKAAAAEMAIRLTTRLGKWVVLPAEELDADLASLDVLTTATNRDRARKLFADVLDLPGGMRIETIHAFCQSLLRRFPLEAGLSPHFQLADDSDAASRLREARETVLADPNMREPIHALAAETDEMCFAELTEKLTADATDIQSLLQNPNALAAMQRAALAAGEHHHDTILQNAVAWEREHHLAQALRRIGEAGNPSGQSWALARLDWLAHAAEHRVINWVDWVSGHFTTTGTGRTLKGHYGKALAAEQTDLHAEMVAEQQRIEQIEEHRRAAKLCALNTSLTQLAAPILAAQTTAKQIAGLLSYADLVNRTRELLKKPGEAAWILYKLDGGIDHLLLDEVQDTAPAQWDIADAIAEEFFAGIGAATEPRSIFAVGDAKQSIFSFQGADLQSFETYRAKFASRVTGAGQKWLNGTLSISFRSAAPVLALVDAVFAAGPARDGVCAPGAELTHGVSRGGQAGAVTLWPLTTAASPEAAPDWDTPDDYTGADSARTLLANAIATAIKSRLDSGEILPSRGRALAPGDFLILVRRRDALVTAITSACKILGLPIAGADRVVLTQAQAVSDLLALCDALLLPEDDLAFGQYLASPLGGLTDASLMRLAMHRRFPLAATLFARRLDQPDWAAASALFTELRAQVDFLTPHALLAQTMFERGGRARLLARLGPEAAEPIDELLTEAAAYASREPASLQAFVHALRTANATIKREGSSSGGVIRIMTVHGAKGLQAPVVILPDTTALPNHPETLFWLHPPQQPDVTVPIFCPRKDLRSAAVVEACEANRAAELAEQNRLLYVALTRAEDELIICGAAGKKNLPEQCWYNLVKAGFDHLGIPAGATGQRTLRSPQSAAPDRKQTAVILPMAPLPTWAGAAPGWLATPPGRETTRPEPLAPSRNTDDEAKRAIAASPLGAVTARSGRAAALAAGRAVHALLQHLPDLPPARRKAAAVAYLANAMPGKPTAATAAAVLQILADPELAPLFGPGSRAEVPLAGVINGVEIGGLVDRLAILPGKILLADYKTDRAVPASPESIPATYLRQLAAYAAVLGQIYPDRPLSCLLIFTATATVMPVPAALLAPQALGHAQARHAPPEMPPYAAATPA